jgi:hypothetical protein
MGMQDPRLARAATVDTGSLYERIQRDFVRTVVALPDEMLQLRVPATPDWSIRDVLAHVVGLAADLNAQRFPAATDGGGTAWANNQVQRGRTRTIGDLVAGWDRGAPTFEDGLRVFGYAFGSHFVADLHAHYQDVRNAMGLSADADGLTVRVALDHYLGFVDEMLSGAAWGTLDVVAGGEARQLGVRGLHQARVRGGSFQVLRAFSGRRSPRQIRALDWEGDIGDLLAMFQIGFTGGYSLPLTDLNE